MLGTLIDLIIENGFTLAKARSRRYSAQAITDPDYADDIAVLTNSPTQAESVRGGRWHSPPWERRQEFLCFNQRGDISTENHVSLKLVVKFSEAASHLPKITSIRD